MTTILDPHLELELLDMPDLDPPRLWIARCSIPHAEHAPWYAAADNLTDLMAALHEHVHERHEGATP